jgi:uncharacterized membrane protein
LFNGSRKQPAGEASLSDIIQKIQDARIRHQHRHPPIINVNQALAERMTLGQRAADAFAAAVGSWTFIIVQSIMLAFWITLNAVAWMRHWDPYPFILLNLALSFQAAYAAPIIMMSQNRQSAKDRLMAEEDYRVNMKAEEELKDVMRHLEAQDDLMIGILRRLEEQHRELLERRITSALPPSA